MATSTPHEITILVVDDEEDVVEGVCLEHGANGGVVACMGPGVGRAVAGVHEIALVADRSRVLGDERRLSRHGAGIARNDRADVVIRPM